MNIRDGKHILPKQDKTRFFLEFLAGVGDVAVKYNLRWMEIRRLGRLVRDKCQGRRSEEGLALRLASGSCQ